MLNSSLRPILTVILAVLSLAACTTLQTTYFRASYKVLIQADHPGLQPYEGTPAFTQVKDMPGKSRQMHGEGFVMLGYSQFISPLFTSLAESYSTKWGAEVNAAHVVLETPKPGPSNLHYYLVTYWARVRPEQFSFGGHVTDLPDELLERIGKELNLVILEQAIAGTPAAAAGLRANDVILAMDGERVLDTKTLTQLIDKNRGKKVDVGISRDGRTMELPVRLAAGSAPAQPSGGKGVIVYRGSPWDNTKPTDWSGLSIAALTSAAVQTYQHQRELEYERARARAEANLVYLNSRSTAAQGPTSRRGGGSVPTSRRGGGAPLPGRGGYGVPYVDQQRAMEQLREYGKSWGAQMDRQRQQNVSIWLNNAPNAYGSMGKWSFPVR